MPIDKEMLGAVAASIDGLAENDLETFENQGDDTDMPPFAYLQVYRMVGLFIDLNEESVEDLINTGFLPDECSGRSKDQVRTALQDAIPARDGWHLFIEGKPTFWSSDWGTMLAEAKEALMQLLADHHPHKQPKDMREIDLRVYHLGHPGTVEIPMMHWTAEFYRQLDAVEALKKAEYVYARSLEKLIHAALQTPSMDAFSEKHTEALVKLSVARKAVIG